jgi:hypothetical protein
VAKVGFKILGYKARESVKVIEATTLSVGEGKGHRRTVTETAGSVEAVLVKGVAVPKKPASD